MNRLPPPSVWNDESADSIRDSVSPDADPIVESSPEIGLLVFTGFVSANFVATLVCRLPQSHTLTWIQILSLSVRYIALTAAVGAAGIALPWLFLKAKPSFRLSFLSKKLGIGWLFLPCITLLYRQHSPWMFLVVGLAKVTVAFSRRPIFPVHPETDQRKFAGWKNSNLPTHYGQPVADFRPVRALVIAVCAQGAIVFAITESLYFASILLSASLFLLAWRWSAFDRSAIRGFARKGPRILLSVLALLMTLLALVPWVGGRLNGTSARNDVPREPPRAHEGTESDKPNSDYVSVILWPPPIKKTKIVPPPPHTPSFAIGATSKPVIIPFDGPYWYFKAPRTRPGPRAHVANGKSTDVNIRSSDSAPLQMEAYQNLGSSIDLRCCSEIEVAVTNADTRPGKIAVGIVLTDSDSIGRPSRSLGERTIVSSEASEISMSRPPVNETLRFTISPSATMHRFDEITVVFLPSRERARAG